MLRLLFYSAALVPLASVPWMTSKAYIPQNEVTRSVDPQYVAEPNMDALTACQTGEVPVFFHDELILTHSAEFITESLKAMKGCGRVNLEIVPILPKEAQQSDIDMSQKRMAELKAYVTSVSDIAEIETDLRILDEPRRDDVSTLYMNGRAATIQIDPYSPIM